MKRILILGAGFLQSFVIKKAKELGYYTIAVDKNRDSIGFDYADESFTIDIVDKEACLAVARAKNIDGVMTAATEYGVLPAAYIAEKLRLPGLCYETAKLTKDKYLVRKRLFENSVDCVEKFFQIGAETDFDFLKTMINYPVIIKPCEGSGSKGVSEVISDRALKPACIKALEVSGNGKALIEEFIDGKEYGSDVLVYNGEIKVMAIMEKYKTKPPVYAELGHCYPSDLSGSIQLKVINTLKKAVHSLGINFGAVNFDYLITKEGDICIADVGARMGGNLIGSHIIPLGTGIDYLANLIRIAVNDGLDMTVKMPPQKVVSLILALTPGEIKRIPDLAEIEAGCGVKIHSLLKAGNTINEYKNNLDGNGYIISVADSTETALRKAMRAKKILDDGIERELCYSDGGLLTLCT